MVKSEDGADTAGKPSLKVKLSSKAAPTKQPADGSTKLKVKLPADPEYLEEPEAIDLVDSDIISDEEEEKPKKRPVKRPKRQPKKAKRSRTPDEACPAS